MSLEYQLALGKESDHSWENLCKRLKIKPYSLTTDDHFHLKELHEAYRYGINKGSEITNRRMIFATICESFFHRIYTVYAVTLNPVKVKEALELIYRFSKCCDMETEDWIEYQDKVIEEMRDWK